MRSSLKIGRRAGKVRRKLQAGRRSSSAPPHLAVPVVEIPEHHQTLGRIRGLGEGHQLPDLPLSFTQTEPEMGGNHPE